MGTKILSISERVYTKLDAERWEGESFDDVITRWTEKKSLMNLVGFFIVHKV
jgi:predicted CopG family antitoxin